MRTAGEPSERAAVIRGFVQLRTPAMETFPRLRGTSLERRSFDIPGGLDGEVNLLFIPFLQRQQSDVDAWFEAVGDLAAKYPGLAAYEIPLLRRFPKRYRRWIDEGMRAGIADPVVRARTITVYTHRARFLEQLGLDDETKIWAGVVARNGAVLWEAVGPVTDVALETLFATLEGLHKAPAEGTA